MEEAEQDDSWNGLDGYDMEYYLSGTYLDYPTLGAVAPQAEAVEEHDEWDGLDGYDREYYLSGRYLD